MAGQTVEVSQVAVPATSEDVGFTGANGTQVDAFFGPPPPTAAVLLGVTFHHYVVKAIPTSLELPCAGSGMVTFVPLPTSTTARDASVRVDFVGQP